MVMVTVVIPR